MHLVNRKRTQQIVAGGVGMYTYADTFFVGVSVRQSELSQDGTHRICRIFSLWYVFSLRVALGVTWVLQADFRCTYEDDTGFTC